MHIPTSTSLGIIPASCRHPFHLPWERPGSMLAPHHSCAAGFVPKRVHTSLTSSNPSRPGKRSASSSARPSLQVIKQCRGQHKLPAGLCARCKPNRRKRDSNRSQSQRVRFLGGSGRQLPSAARPGIVLPEAAPGKATSAGTPAWRSPAALPPLAAKVPVPPALPRSPLCGPRDALLVPPATSSCPFSRRQQLLSTAWLRCPFPKLGEILLQLPRSSRPPLLLVRWDGLEPGQELLPSPSSETKGQARRWDLQAPTHVQIAPGTPRCANPDGVLAMCKPPRGARNVQTPPRAPHDVQTAPGLPVGRAARRAAGWI